MWFFMSLLSLVAVAQDATPPEQPAATSEATEPDVADDAVATPPRAPVGTVTGSEGRRVVIDRGARDGVQIGDPIGLYDVTAIRIGDDTVEELALRTVGRAVAISEEGAVVAVGVNQDVPVGARAQEVPSTSGASFLAPPRLGGRGFLRADLRGLVSMADAGGGTYVAGALGYRFKLPLALELRATPIFMGIDDQGRGQRDGVGKGTVVALMSFDHHLIAIGLGAGVALNPASAPRPVFAQRLRVGAEDGLSFTFTSQLTQLPSDAGYAQWEVDLNEAVVQIPMSAKRMPTWLILRGLGGEFGGGGYVGARFRVHGNGAQGTWGLTPFVGGERYVSGDTDLAGPAFGLGIDAEF